MVTVVKARDPLKGGKGDGRAGRPGEQEKQALALTTTKEPL